MKIYNKQIIEIWEQYKHLSLKERTKIFNEKYKTNFVPRTLYTRYNIYKEVMKEFDEEAQMEIFAKRELHLLEQQKKNTFLKKEAHKVAKQAVDLSFWKEEFLKHINNIKFTRLSSGVLKKVDKSETIVFFKSDDHFRGEEEDILIQREFYKNIFSIALNQNKKKITLIFGGDEIEGALHLSSLIYANKSPQEQMKLFVQETISGIDLLASHFNVELFYLTSSNHTQSRHLGSNRNEFLRADLSLISAEMIELVYKNQENVKINVGGVFRNRKIDGLGDHSVCITHGGLKFENSLKGIASHYDDCDLILKGHTHSFKIENIMETMVITAPTLKTFVTDFELDHGFLRVDEQLDYNNHRWAPEFLELYFDDNEKRIIKHEF